MANCGCVTQIRPQDGSNNAAYIYAPLKLASNFPLNTSALKRNT